MKRKKMKMEVEPEDLLQPIYTLEDYGLIVLCMDRLYEAGYDTVWKLSRIDEERLLRLPDIGERHVEMIKDSLRLYLESCSNKLKEKRES